MGAALDKVGDSVSGLPGPPFSECCPRFLGFVLPTPTPTFSTWATQSQLPGALGTCRRSASSPSDLGARVGGIDGTSPRGERPGAQDTRPAPDRAGRVGARLS